ncbi:ANTAR domain-containing protein [Nonomuraea sp. B12E4]|uniref:ANTAR domain-containing protein n=1 Tax=Nonomuraea sp. B12E4 TaxID=3153564 RepID=UPI00325F3F82
MLYIVLQAGRHTEITAQLRRAITERAIIEQAMGVIMGQRRCTASEAFALLRANSQNRNRRLRDVAADIIKVFTGHLNRLRSPNPRSLAATFRPFRLRIETRQSPRSGHSSLRRRAVLVSTSCAVGAESVARAGVGA